MNYFIKRVLLGVFVIFVLWFGAKAIFNSPENVVVGEADIHFFYSQTCPYCHEEHKFLDDLQTRYPDLLIARHDVSKRATAVLLKEFGEKYDVESYLGVVPLTFVYDSFILGFNTPETTGKAIEDIVIEKLNTVPVQETAQCEDSEEICVVPSEQNVVDDQNYTSIDQLSNLSLFGINAKDLSLPVLAIVLGFFDGFNVCSLGALLLILSLVFVFKSRKKVFLFGTIFLVITGITYAALIFLWFGLFSFFSSFVTLFQVLIALMGIIGGIYFIRQYIRFRKYGPMCEMTESEWIKKATKKLQGAFSENKNIWIIILAVVVFSFAVTVIEFPCSAVIPVAFAAILTEAGVGLLGKIGYLSIFMLLYLLDEIIVFFIGVSTMRIWIGGQKMTKHLSLIQGLMFIGLGIFYITRLIS